MTPQAGGVHCGETYPTDGPNLKRMAAESKEGQSLLSNVPGFSQGAPTRRGDGWGMTNDSFRQRRPDRRSVVSSPPPWRP